MPLYEYRCKSCGEEFEKMVRFSETQSPICPTCSSQQTEKKLSLVATRGFSGGLSLGSASSSCGPSSGGFS